MWHNWEIVGNMRMSWGYMTNNYAMWSDCSPWQFGIDQGTLTPIDGDLCRTLTNHWILGIREKDWEWLFCHDFCNAFSGRSTCSGVTWCSRILGHSFHSTLEVGDEKQLPATVLNSQARETGLGVSLFELGCPKAILQLHLSGGSLWTPLEIWLCTGKSWNYVGQIGRNLSYSHVEICGKYLVNWFLLNYVDFKTCRWIFWQWKMCQYVTQIEVLIWTCLTILRRLVRDGLVTLGLPCGDG